MLLPEADAMTSETTWAESQRNKEIVVAAFDRWAAGGSDFFNEMLDPDVVWTIQGSGRVRARTGAAIISLRAPCVPS